MLQHARGMHFTIVNGEVLVEGGEYTGAHPGHVVRNAAAVEASRGAA